MAEGIKQLAAWFLGPKAENASLEEEMLLYILRDYFHWRRNYYPSDEIIVTQHMRRESLDFSDALFQQLTEMLNRLKRHFPFYSPRYIAHMLSDQTIPSVLGYFAGMLYNPNNVTPEAAPVTVEWELEVAADILRMLGYQAPPPRGAHHRETKREFGWAHITSGGTVANLEALWVARNVRYFPLAVREAAIRERIPIAVKLPGSNEATRLADMNEQQCLSMKPNSAVFLLPRFIDAVRQRFGLTYEDASLRAWELTAATSVSISAHGTKPAYDVLPPALFIAGTAHYSIAKCADILGIGKDNVHLVGVDALFRMDVRDLEDKMRAAIRGGQYPLAVITIGGTTEEGAVDPVHRVVEFRQRCEQENRYSFWLHVDAAWGGYLRSMFAGAEDHVNTFASRRLEIKRDLYSRTVHMQWGSRDVVAAFEAFCRAESVTVDPHKMGYIPYPCGVVAFRNDRVRHYLTAEAPYLTVNTQANAQARVYQPPANIGPFILEGSKPGAAAASCWLSHKLIRPDRSGYGQICRASVLAARELYERLVHWEQSCRANKVRTAYRFVPITAPPPDTNIVCFIVCEKEHRSLVRANALTRAVYERFTIQAELGERDYAYSQPFFLSRTRFHLPNYSERAVAELLERAALDSAEYPAAGIFVLRATLMNPYLSLAAETGHKQSLLGEFVEWLAEVTTEVLPQVDSLTIASCVPVPSPVSS